MNRMLLQILLCCALSVTCSQSCWQSSDCNYMHCKFGSHCVIHHHHQSGNCECAGCRSSENCHSCPSDRPHGYCSLRDWNCHCVECLHHSDCHCKAGQIGECSNAQYPWHHCICHDLTTTTTTQQPLVKLECNHQKISVIESIAENLHVEDSRAALCPGTTKHQTSEAFVINKCNSTARSSWSKGEQVKTECSNIPFSPYTPISTFSDQGNNMAAFLIDCTKTTDGVITGLTIAVQTCNDAPMVMKLNETTTPRMADFYTILQRK